MACLRDSWRTNLPASQQLRNLSRVLRPESVSNSGERDAERPACKGKRNADHPASHAVLFGFRSPARRGPVKGGSSARLRAQPVVAGGQACRTGLSHPASRPETARVAHHRMDAAGPPLLRPPDPVITAAPSVEVSGRALAHIGQYCQEVFARTVAIAADPAAPRRARTATPVRSPNAERLQGPASVPG